MSPLEQPEAFFSDHIESRKQKRVPQEMTISFPFCISRAGTPLFPLSSSLRNAIRRRANARTGASLTQD
jgi:hypothetical protein